MRKPTLLTAAAALLLGVASNALGQVSTSAVMDQGKSYTMGIFYGGSEPWQEAGGYYDHDYYLFGATAGVEGLTSWKAGSLGLRMDLGYIPWKMKSGRSDYKSTIMMLTFRAAWNWPVYLNGRLRIAPTAGVGFYPIGYSVPVTEGEEPANQAKAGVNFGGELSFLASNKVLLTLSAIHHIVFTDYVGRVGGKRIDGETPFTVLSLTASYVFPAE
jgi:hypothetical protein